MSNIDLVYLFMHKKLKEKSINNFITKKESVMFLSHTFRIPKKYGYAVLKELEEFGLIRSSGDSIEILKSKVDLDNTSDIFKRVGLN